LNALFPDPGMTERLTEVPVTLQDDPILRALRDATIRDYEILAELGRGGLAVVYLAHDLALDRKVAIKVMFPALLAGEGAAERFKREAKTAASLTHPNIIPIYAVKEYESLLYFVMQFVSGGVVDSVLGERKISRLIRRCMHRLTTVWSRPCSTTTPSFLPKSRQRGGVRSPRVSNT
jgi:serine/threonine protein kinase